MSKKNNEKYYTSSTAGRYFLDKILPTIIGAAIAACAAIFAMYFRFESVADATAEFPTTYVRKDVQAVHDQRIEEKIDALTETTNEIRDKLNTL